MGRKVFISFLGTNNYVETIYSFGENKQSKPVRFIQEALIVNNCIGWSEKDRIYIFCTQKAKAYNWLDNGQQKITEDIERIGLEHRLQDLHLNVPFEMVPIAEGFSEEEIWSIFETVYDKLEKDDEIYFDVTHAFRSIPLFSTILFNYSHFMKDTEVKAIQYGAFEKLGTAPDVHKMPIEERVAPIIDLKSLLNLQIYNQIADGLRNYGRVSGIADALDDGDNVSVVFKQLANSINDFDGYILTNRSHQVESGNVFISLRNMMKPVAKGVPAPMKRMLEYFSEELAVFKAEKTLDNVKAAVNWAQKYDMLPQAYTLGQEYIISLCVNRLIDRNPYGNSKNGIKNFREFVSGVLNISDKDLKKNNFKNKLCDFPDLAMKLLDLDWIKALKHPFAELSKWRNYINHAKSGESPEDFKKKFGVFYGQCLCVFQD